MALSLLPEYIHENYEIEWATYQNNSRSNINPSEKPLQAGMAMEAEIKLSEKPKSSRKDAKAQSK